MEIITTSVIAYMLFYFSMFENGSPFRELDGQSKIVLATILGVSLLLATILPALNISVVPAVSAAPPEDNSGKKVGQGKKAKFEIMEATIEDIQNAIKTRKVTATNIVNMYLERIKAYNGVCVDQPEGILGPITTIPNAGKVNAFITLNLRPEHREEWGFDERKARSMTDPADNDPDMPDALEVAAELDEEFARTDKLVGPLHGVVIGIKDQYDTFDMRTTSGADAFYYNDRPPDDATFVAKLREAGAIVLGKTNMGEYAAGGIKGVRSSFGGTMCNPYDTERDPGSSSGGSGIAVATNMVTCAIGEETGSSIREPAKNNNAVGIAPTRELVSGDGMMEKGITTRVGPICRTVEDTARVLDVFAGFDPKDELTAFSFGRMPSEPYHSFATVDKDGLDGMRIGVVREFMDKSLFSVADHESIDIIDKAIDDLRDLGATIVDPGEGGALFQDCVDKVTPIWRNQLFISEHPDLFPVDPEGDATEDHIPLLIDMYSNTSRVSGNITIRDLGEDDTTGVGKYNLNFYLHERGDPEIQTLQDLIDKANFWEDPVIENRKSDLEDDVDDSTLNDANDTQDRFTMRTIVHCTFAQHDLDAVVYPTGNVPPPIITNPPEPTMNDRSGGGIWIAINRNGFPATTVPAGFTTHVFDRDADLNLVGPTPAKLPVGIDFLALPFDEPTVFKIAATYEAATQHRTPPPDFGPLE